MGGFFEKNMEAMRKYQPEFVLPDSRETGAELKFEVCKLPGGDLDINCEHKGGRLYIHGGAAPLHTAKERTAQIVLKGNGLIVSFGLGFGHEAREIIRKMDTGTNFVIVEPCAEILNAVLQASDVTDIISAPNVHFYIFDDKQSALVYFSRFINSNNYRNLAAFVVAPYVDLFFSNCRDLLFVIDDLRASLEVGEHTVRRFTSIWQKNALLNLKHNLNSYLVSDFFGKFDGLPAVIVSAGPSLSKNIGILKELMDRCVIISVDTALKPLLENGVSPHFVVSVDAQDIVARKFSGLDYSAFPLIYVPTSSSAVVDGHSGAKLLSVFQDDFYKKQLDTLGKDTTPIEMGGSVATSAFSFAQHAGCDPIVLVGQDLAFTGMKSHVEGSPFYKEISVTKDMVAVPSVDGGTVYTDRILFVYITWFQTYAASDKSGRTYIDATEGGTDLLGFENARLVDVAEKHMKSAGVSERVGEIFQSAPLLSASDRKFIRNEYKEAAAFIDSIKTQAATASKQLSLIHRLLSKKRANIHAINSAYSKISSFEQKIRREAGKLDVLGIAISPFSEKLNSEFENAEFKNDLEKNMFAAVSYSKYYGEIADRSAEFIGLLKETI